MIKAALKGWMNRDEEIGRKKKLRQPITILHLQMMKILLRMNEQGWSLVAFWGALR